MGRVGGHGAQSRELITITPPEAVIHSWLAKQSRGAGLPGQRVSLGGSAYDLGRQMFTHCHASLMNSTLLNVLSSC